MAVPQESYMKLNAGTNAGNSTIYTDSLIKIGDTIKITGTVNNNGVFTVTDITTQSTDVYYVLKGNPITSENSGGDPQIEVIRATGDKLVALGDVDSAGNIDVWSSNATSDYSAKDNGWTAAAIQPTLDGNDAKYIYHFVDEALRVCNINEENTSSIKWYGYIQRHQFSLPTGLVFAEWQEHPNALSPPKNTVGFTFAYGTTSHSGSTATNYYTNLSSGEGANRGVVKYKEESTEDDPLRLDGAHNATTTAFTFEDTDNVDVLDQSIVGEVISISNTTALDTDTTGTYPQEFLFCTKESTGSTITYSRAYGGALGGTAPFASFADTDSPILERGLGFNIGVDDGSADGDWEAATYEFYQSFIYDGNQESLPIKMGNGAATIAVFTHACAGAVALQVSVYADLAYNGRVSGGRIYIRKQNTTDDLTLLADIDIVKGVRMTLNGNHVPWTYQSGKGYYVVANATGNSIVPNIDTYETINGFSPDVKFISIGGRGEMYKSSVIANRRTFVANLKIFGASGELEKHGDRIMYSEINRFDTFPEPNFIDVSKGDYGEYTALETYADRLIAFKHNLVHIINIANPSPANWYLEDTIKYFGANKPFSITRTSYGIAWVNDAGCFLYDGQKVNNLTSKIMGATESTSIDNSVDVIVPSWASFARGSANAKDPMIGYDAISNSLLIVRSPDHSSTNTNQAFIYDFDSGGWVYNTTIFAENSGVGYTYTNFVTDWNKNLTVGKYDNSSDVEFYKYLPVKSATTGQRFSTRDIDFGMPGVTKKVYSVTMTYRSSAEQQLPLNVSADGIARFSQFATGTNVTPQGSTGGAGYLESTGNGGDTYDVAKFVADTPVTCQSIAFELNLPSSGLFEVNDMTIEYRVIPNKMYS